MDSLNWENIEDRQNSIWYEYNDADTVIVFIHGLHSKSRNSWLYEPTKSSPKRLFWPDLIRSDKRFGNPALFLASYYTALDAGQYGIQQCADAVFDALSRTDRYEHKSVMQYPRIVFVGHSMGGIIARYILTRHWDEFVDKQIGVALIASPSRGADMADRLEIIANTYAHRQVEQLRTDSEFLDGLDRDFRELVDKHRIPQLIGEEACEHHFYVHSKWLPIFSKYVLVAKESAGQYFGPVTMLPGTDHSTCVKPDSLDHPVHNFLVDFWERFQKTKSLSNTIKSFSGLSIGLAEKRIMKLRLKDDINEQAGEPDDSDTRS